MRKEDIEKLWNDQADEYNQWSELDSDEKVEWTIQCFEKGTVAEFEGDSIDDIYEELDVRIDQNIIDNGKKYKIIIKEVG